MSLQGTKTRRWQKHTLTLYTTRPVVNVSAEWTHCLPPEPKHCHFIIVHMHSVLCCLSVWKKIKLENMAIARHCNLRPPGLRPQSPVHTPTGKVVIPKSKCVLNLNFLALIVSEIWGGSQIYTWGAVPLRCLLGENFIYKMCTWPCVNVCKISTRYV